MEEQKAYALHWKERERLLTEIKRREMQAMTQEDRWHQMEALFGLSKLENSPSWREKYSGLIEQQALFHKARHE